jgi:hypothetical protein
MRAPLAGSNRDKSVVSVCGRPQSIAAFRSLYQHLSATYVGVPSLASIIMTVCITVLYSDWVADLKNVGIRSYIVTQRYAASRMQAARL